MFDDGGARGNDGDGDGDDEGDEDDDDDDDDSDDDATGVSGRIIWKPGNLHLVLNIVHSEYTVLFQMRHSPSALPVWEERKA